MLRQWGIPRKQRTTGFSKQLRDYNEPGFWEGSGYHNYGNPWLEQRYAGH